MFFEEQLLEKKARQLEKYINLRKILLLKDQLCLNQHRKKLNCQLGVTNQGL